MNNALATQENNAPVLAVTTPVAIGEFFSSEKTGRVHAFDIGVPIEILGEEGGARTVQIGDDVYDFQEPLNAFVVQPGHISKNEAMAAHLGKLYVDEMAEAHVTRDFLLIGDLTTSRQLFVGPESDKECVCYSSDGIVPHSSVLAPMSDFCSRFYEDGGHIAFKASCPKAMWGEDKQRPECAEKKTVLLFDLDYGVPIKISIKGLGLSSWNDLFKYKARAKLANGIKTRIRIAQRSGQDLVAVLNEQPFVVRMTIAKEETKKGSAYTMSFKSVSAPEREPAKFLPLVWRYATEFIVTPKSYQEAARERNQRELSDMAETAQLASTDIEPVVDAVEFEM